MKNNSMSKFLIERLMGISIIALGTYLIVCYLLKVLPFGLTFTPASDNLFCQAIWIIWGWGGLVIAGATLVGGFSLLFKEARKQPKRKYTRR